MIAKGFVPILRIGVFAISVEKARKGLSSALTPRAPRHEIMPARLARYLFVVPLQQELDRDGDPRPPQPAPRVPPAQPLRSDGPVDQVAAGLHQRDQETEDREEVPGLLLRPGSQARGDLDRLGYQAVDIGFLGWLRER